MQTLIRSTKHIGFLAIALTVAFAANFAYGQWANPTAAPTGGSIAAPINTGSDLQHKVGNLRSDEFHSDAYCDSVGGNCSSGAEIRSAVDYIASAPSQFDGGRFDTNRERACGSRTVDFNTEFTGAGEPNVVITPMWQRQSSDEDVGMWVNWVSNVSFSVSWCGPSDSETSRGANDDVMWIAIK